MILAGLQVHVDMAGCTGSGLGFRLVVIAIGATRMTGRTIPYILWPGNISVIVAGLTVADDLIRLAT